MQLANRRDLVALAFRACGKTLAPCHSERSEESRQLEFQRTTEILRRLRLLRMTVHWVFPQPVQASNCRPEGRCYFQITALPNMG